MVHFHGLRLDQQLSAGGHRIAGVDREIQDNLLNHAPVGVDRRHVFHRSDFQGDVFAQNTAQHIDDLADHLVEVEMLLLH